MLRYEDYGGNIGSMVDLKFVVLYCVFDILLFRGFIFILFRVFMVFLV